MTVLSVLVGITVFVPLLMVIPTVLLLRDVRTGRSDPAFHDRDR